MMRWSRLLKNLCPKCNNPIQSVTRNGHQYYECAARDLSYMGNCDFSVTKKRYDELRINIAVNKGRASMEAAPESNLQALSELENPARPVPWYAK